MLKKFRAHYATRRHTTLLAAIIAAFVVRPLVGDVGFGPVAFSISMLFLLLVAIYNIDIDELIGDRDKLIAQRRRRAIIGWILLVPAVAERVASNLWPSPTMILVGSIWWMCLLIFITRNQLLAVLRQKEVTRETISMSISVYLLIGLTWGFFYIVLYDLQPQAFSFGSVPVGTGAEQHAFPVLIYFSLTTLSTIGFGDITPLTLQARYAAVAEGITGQFYLAILVARLVGIYMTRVTNPTDSQKPAD
jgi:ion channel